MLGEAPIKRDLRAISSALNNACERHIAPWIPQIFLKKCLELQVEFDDDQTNVFEPSPVGHEERLCFREKDGGLANLVDKINDLRTRKRAEVAIVTYYLEENEVLVVDLTLPRQASANLQSAIEYRIEDLSPFPPDQTYFSFKEHVGPPGLNQCHLSVAIASRDAVDQIAQRLGRLVPAIPAVAVRDPRCSGIDLIPLANRHRPDMSANMLVCLLLTAVLLGITSLVLPSVLLSNRIEEAEDAVAEAQAKASVVLKARDEFRQIQQQASVVSREHNRQPSLALALNEVERALPAETSVTDITYDGMKLQISGTSSAQIEIENIARALSAGSAVLTRGSHDESQPVGDPKPQTMPFGVEITFLRDSSHPRLNR